jgi:hypothetical protein
VRADIHDGQEHKRSMQGPDTDAQDQPPPFVQIRLATHGRSIQLGQYAKCSRRVNVFRIASDSRPSLAWRPHPNHGLRPPSARPIGCSACLWGKQRVSLGHDVRDQNSLGANRHRLCDRARYDVGSHAVGGLEARIPTAAWTSVVRVDIGSSDLSSAVVLLVVVSL